MDAILSIPLRTHGARDRLIWAKSKNGKFLVRSAYRLAQEISTEGNSPESSNPAALKQVWKDLWNMRVSNKIKHFAWRACRDILATKENLWKRRITKDNICESCGKEPKSACHIFWFCDSAKEVWSSSKLILPIKINPSWKFIDALWKLQKWSDTCPDLVEHTVTLCWGIWKYRNERRHGGVRRNGLALVRSLLRLLDEFQVVNENPHSLRTAHTQGAKWCPPQPGSYKVNVDGAVFTKRKQVGIEVVIRDSAGEVVAVLSQKLARPLGALEIEAKAMEVAAQFALDAGVRDVTFKGDSLSICNALRGGSEVSSSVQNIIFRLSHLVRNFRSYAFSHIKRQGNIPAHLLAQHASGVESYIAWVEECPSLIEQACARDICT